MRDVVWAELAQRHDMDRDVPSTWTTLEPTGLKTSKQHRAFAPICGPRLTAALDDLFGADRWVPPKQFGNVLVTLPNATSWRVPAKVWHSDFPPTLPRDELRAVKVWALLDDIDAGGGGTPQLAGSHRAFAQYLERTGDVDYKRAKFGFLDSHGWLQLLTHDDGTEHRNDVLI